MIIRSDTPFNLWKSLNWEIICNPHHIEGYRGTQAFGYSADLQVDSFSDQELDMGKHVGYTPYKWSILVKGYLHEPSFNALLERARYYLNKRGEIPSLGMVFLGDRLGAKAANAKSAQTGPCLLSLSLMWSKGSNPGVTIHSRSSEVTQRFYADLVFINVILRTLGDELGFTPDQVGVRWIIPYFYQTYYQVIPFLSVSGLEESFLEQMSDSSKWCKLIHKAYESWFSKPQGEIKYATRRRIVNHYRYLKYGEGDYSSLLPSGLSLGI